MVNFQCKLYIDSEYAQPIYNQNMNNNMQRSEFQPMIFENQGGNQNFNQPYPNPNFNQMQCNPNTQYNNMQGSQNMQYSNMTNSQPMPYDHNMTGSQNMMSS